MQVLRIKKRAILSVSTMLLLLIFYAAYTYNDTVEENIFKGLKNIQNVISETDKNYLIIILLIVVIVSIVIFLIKTFTFWIHILRGQKKKYDHDSEEGRGRLTSPNFTKSFTDTKPTKGPSGLNNEEETCFMNSMIQAMASSERLINAYNKILEKNEEECLNLILFRDLLENINSPKSRLNCLRENTDKLKEMVKYAKWNKVSQQDTFQLLSAFIKAIQQDIKGYLAKEGITMPPKMKLLHTFTKSPDYNKVQEHLALALPLCGDFRNQPGVKLNTLMDAFFESSPIDDGHYKTQISLFQEAPNILILHIQANEWDDSQRTYIKPKYYIIYEGTMEYAFNIHMKKDGSEIKKTKVVYKLTAVVHHMGSISGGHYVTYRTHEGSWYLTNDSQVEEVSFNYDKAPYVMVYEKIT